MRFIFALLILSFISYFEFNVFLWFLDMFGDFLAKKDVVNGSFVEYRNGETIIRGIVHSSGLTTFTITDPDNPSSYHIFQNRKFREMHLIQDAIND